MSFLQILKSQRWLYISGAFSTLGMLNEIQKKEFVKLFFKGDLEKRCKLSGGTEDPETTYYIIRHDFQMVGLFSIFISVAGDIMFAHQNNMIPVVDMRHYRNPYLDKKATYNPWEMFFEQPGGVSLDHAYKGMNIVLSPLIVTEDRPNDTMSFFNNENNILLRWRELAEEYLHPLNDIILKSRQRYEKITGGNKKVLGVAVRGTDYVQLKPPNHPVQPETDLLISDAEKMMIEKGYEIIFLNTEDKEIASKFKKHFGDKYIENKRELVDYSGGYIMDRIREQNSNEKIASGREYLITQLMMNMTNGLLASRCSGTVGSFVLPSRWEDIYIYDLGRYPA